MINLTVLMDTYRLIKDYSTWADEVFAREIPDEYSDNKDKTIILVRDAYSRTSLFASNTFNSLISNMVIQIYYAEENDLDYDAIEINFMKYLEKHGIRTTDIKGRLIDNNQDYQTLQVAKRINTKDKGK